MEEHALSHQLRLKNYFKSEQILKYTASYTCQLQKCCIEKLITKQLKLFWTLNMCLLAILQKKKKKKKKSFRSNTIEKRFWVSLSTFQ